MTSEQIKHNVTGHTSNAFERYFLPNHQEAIMATCQVVKMQGDKLLINFLGGKKRLND